jgi:hypothetical protein
MRFLHFRYAVLLPHVFFNIVLTFVSSVVHCMLLKAEARHIDVDLLRYLGRPHPCR